ncbi:hypothetical protein JCM1841_002531 [Sporobolomyces salmonicolor]
MLYALTALLDLTAEVYDVKSAFLGAAIDQPVFVHPPPGFAAPPGQESLVWELRKSLYGKDPPLRQLVGCLRYLSCWTRPDIAAAISHVASFVSKPKPAAWTAAKGILHYLKGTRSIGLRYSSSGASAVQIEALFSFSPPTMPSLLTDLLVYSDTDWAACLDTQRSTTRNIVLLAGSPIDWVIHCQQTVSMSTSQAEYQALTETGGQLVFLRGLLAELGFPPIEPTIMHGDNQASLAMAKATSPHRYTHHIDTKYHYIRELVAAGVVAISYVTTCDMLTDILTKGLGHDLHSRFVRPMGVSDTSHSRGSAEGTLGRQGREEVIRARIL